MKAVDEQRKAERYPVARDVEFDFFYDFKSAMKVSEQVETKTDQRIKYYAQSKNVSLQGLCFKCEKHLDRGDVLDLELLIPGDDEAVRLQGEVRWVKSLPEEEGHVAYDIGVKVCTVNGIAADSTIYFDKNYHVYWSEVLESILGKFRIIQQQKQQQLRST